MILDGPGDRRLPLSRQGWPSWRYARHCCARRLAMAQSAVGSLTGEPQSARTALYVRRLAIRCGTQPPRRPRF
jgi:hypothetical protein